MRKKLLFTFAVLFLWVGILFAQQSPGFLSLTEEDGSPDCYGWQIKATNGTVTDNGDGSCSLAISGAPGAEVDPVWTSEKGGYITEAEGAVYALASALSGYVTTTTTITINGVTQDLSAPRNWTVTGSQWTGDANTVSFNGNVGIGSAAPQAKLDVEGLVYFGTGNVGIGTSAPAAKLQIGVNPTVYGGSAPVFSTKGNVNVDGNIYVNSRLFGGIIRGSFNNGDLSAGVLTITHNLNIQGTYPVILMIYNNSNAMIIPDTITGSANSVAVDLTSYGTLSGTWSYILIAG